MSNFGHSANGDQPENRVLSPQFLSAAHRFQFFEQLNQLSRSQQTNPEYQAVLFIMTSNDELYGKMRPYFGTSGFRHTQMFEENDFSSSYAKLAKVAATLYGQEYELALPSLLYSFDHEHFHTFLQALIIRKYGVHAE